LLGELKENTNFDYLRQRITLSVVLGKQHWFAGGKMGKGCIYQFTWPVKTSNTELGAGNVTVYNISVWLALMIWVDFLTENQVAILRCCVLQLMFFDYF
jgi:hypothetical protein